MKVVILAINALEADLVEAFDVPHLKLDDRGRLTIPDDLPLHTEVLWPTIITGVKPDVHGLTRTDAREWENPILQFAADVSTTIVPKEYLLPIGKRIQKLGFDRESKTGPSYYEERGIDTIFSGVRSRAIDVPGYSVREDADEVRKLMGHDQYEPENEELFLAKTEERFKQRRAELFESLNDPADLVMCYFQTLDNLQHVYWEDQKFIEEWYGRFDGLVDEVQNELSADDVIIVMSDHGMKAGEGPKGEHSAHGYYASTMTLDLSNIMDLKSSVDRIFIEETGAEPEQG